VVTAADIDGEPCDEVEALVIGGMPPPTRVRIWIAQSDSLVRRISRDLEATVEQTEAIVHGAEAEMREAGLLVVQVDGIGAPSALSTFELTTFHPRCNEPVAPKMIRATDGSL
jgi:hypothetical protein